MRLSNKSTENYLSQGLFESTTKLFWLDLSNNVFRTFDKSSFRRIANIILDGKIPP